MATVAEIVTNTIIKKLEAGVIPWHKEWTGGEAVNYITQKPYTGINRLLLDGGEYLTYKQIQDKGGKIKKGAKTSIVVFYKPLQITDEETDEIKDIRLLRYYRVFSINDVEGIESKQTIIDKPVYSIENCQKVIDDYIAKSGITFEAKTSTKAYKEVSQMIKKILLYVVFAIPSLFFGFFAYFYNGADVRSSIAGALVLTPRCVFHIFTYMWVRFPHESPKQNNPNFSPIGDGFGFLFYL